MMAMINQNFTMKYKVNSGLAFDSVGKHPVTINEQEMMNLGQA